MPKIEFESVNSPYEFEDRADLFIEEIGLIANDFPDLDVSAENKTIRDLDANAWACKKSAERKNSKMYSKAFERGIEKDILSATETAVMVSVRGSRRKSVDELIKRIDKCAAEYRGKRGDSVSDSRSDAETEESVYFIYIDYHFRD